MDLSGAHVLDPSGHFVSEDHRQIAELINDWDSEIELRWIPPDKRNFNEEFPYALFHSPMGQQPYIIRKVRFHEVNPGLIAWLWSNDQARGNTNPMAMLEAMDKAQEALRMKKQMEQMEEANDLAASILASPLNTYKHNGIKYQ